MLILECSQGCYGRTDDRRKVDEGIIIMDAVEDYARRWIKREVDQDPELESLSD
jgi:hypothetical protein